MQRPQPTQPEVPNWSIHVRSPFAPAKASWNRKNG